MPKYTSCILIGPVQSAPKVPDPRAVELLARDRRFDTIAFHVYPDGYAVTDWHDDRQLCCGNTSEILSIGATRTFEIRDKQNQRVIALDVRHGDIFWMDPDFHDHYQHRIAPDPGLLEERWSFVFRRTAVQFSA
jgi:alkylated DNA repair dioxygenase AlkB